MSECPSKAWDRHIATEERAATPTDAEMLQGLDAYGKLIYTVGFSNEAHGDWLACFDFEVFDHPDRGKLVAYHVVVDSDSGGFTDTMEAAVVPADKAPLDLPDYWAGIAGEHGGMTDEDFDQSNAVNKSWNDDLRAALRESA